MSIFETMSSWLSSHLKSDLEVTTVGRQIPNSSESFIKWRLMLVCALVVAIFCFLLFIFCFETWAVDSPVGFWNWHS